MDRQASRFRVQDRVSASGVGGSKAKQEALALTICPRAGGDFLVQILINGRMEHRADRC